MADFGLVHQFFIDAGQLDAHEKPKCFVLGYEFATVIAALESPRLATLLLHADNLERVEAACQRVGRQYTVRWELTDSSENWMTLTISAKLSLG